MNLMMIARAAYPNHGGERKGWNSVGNLEDVFEGDRVHIASASSGVAGQCRQQLSWFVATDCDNVRVIWAPRQVYRCRGRTCEYTVV